MKVKLIIGLFFLFFIINKSISQNVFPRTIFPEEYELKYDSLFVKFQENKDFPYEYKKQFLIALSAYPEFEKTNINVQEKNIKTTMACRPTVVSLIFRKKLNRKYKIFINSDSINSSGILLNKLSFNSQIGVVGHELGHVFDYSQKSCCTVFVDAIGYLFLSQREKFEKKVDIITIQKGLGMQLFDFAYYIQYQSNASIEYKEYKRRIYLTPEEIKEILNNSGINFEK